MRPFLILSALLAAAGLGGCAAKTVPAGQDVEPFVGKMVTIEGTVERSAAIMPNRPQGNTFCLTIPPGRWVAPVRETTLQHGNAMVAFESPADQSNPTPGDRVRVTGRLQRLDARVVGAEAPQYELRDARWERIGEMREETRGRN